MTLWLQKPRTRRPRSVAPLTAEERMEQARETFKKRVGCIDRSDLPADAKRHARREAERQYIRDVDEVLRCR